MEISNYKNHRRFSIRCLSKGVIPVSLKLKNTIRTYKRDCIIYQAEKKLLNERIRNINNTIEHLDHVKYMYENNLKTIVGPEMFKQCEDYLNTVKEVKHLKALQ